MENNLVEWFQFRLKQLKAARDQLDGQMKMLASQIQDLDYEMQVITAAIMENEFEKGFRQ